jgi:hypothetical protein
LPTALSDLFQLVSGGHGDGRHVRFHIRPGTTRGRFPAGFGEARARVGDRLSERLVQEDLIGLA